eukprot:TRINITY_DN3272_c0_g3_i2.p1 TRINITY_DN3272_c0_g3~~TRINITY_DN3272_c0_g3_i2.p1  ORF type:complete len:716 (+),score=105.38 TRINITY_DN3272_c0_g3_i2:581-2728(+)
MREQKNIVTGMTLSDIENAVDDLTVNPETPMLSQEMGLLLYGPPGTGKTRLVESLSLLCGITEVVPPLASSDMNRPHVGETELVLRDLFFRAKKLPHLLCCICVDEIDSLTPKRTQKLSEHAVSALSTILALLGGIKEVKNIYVFASTNRMAVMDDAILRRLTSKIFIGRPDAMQRRKTYEGITETSPSLSFRNQDVLDTLVDITLNFSGAAMAKLRSKIISYHFENLRETIITREVVLTLATLVAKNYQIMVGTYLLPELYMCRTMTRNLDFQYRMQSGTAFTGRALVKLFSAPERSDPVFRSTCSISLEKNKNEQKRAKYFPIPGGNLGIPELIPVFVDFAKYRGIQFIQLFDADLLSANAAYDEEKTQEIITDRLQECRGYRRSMIVVDLDSFAGISVSQSLSSMGPSTSYNFINQKMLAWTLDVFKRLSFDKPTEGKKTENNTRCEHWMFVICSSSFSYDTFKTMSVFPDNEVEIEMRRREEEDDDLLVKCKHCQQMFLRSKNEFGECTSHRQGVKNIKRKSEMTFNVIRFDDPEFDSYKHACCGASYDPMCKNGCVKNRRHEAEKEDRARGERNDAYKKKLNNRALKVADKKREEKEQNGMTTKTTTLKRVEVKAPPMHATPSPVNSKLNRVGNPHYFVNFHRPDGTKYTAAITLDGPQTGRALKDAIRTRRAEGNEMISLMYSDLVLPDTMELQDLPRGVWIDCYVTKK